MKEFNGKVLFLDRSDINTDEIIPAKYLTEIEKTAMKPHLLEDLKLEGFDPKTDIKGTSVIISQDNFGCGSSREHAPWALEVNGIHAVIAPSFARIFRQNMFNCGMLAIELPKKDINDIFNQFQNKETEIQINMDASEISVLSASQIQRYSFEISKFDRTLVETGGWVEYADKNY